jgi:hypothetical protein
MPNTGIAERPSGTPAPLAAILVAAMALALGGRLVLNRRR